MHTGLSRRSVDNLIKTGRITVDDHEAKIGMDVSLTNKIKIDDRLITNRLTTTILILNKPAGYVVSRNGQGQKTIYELIPPSLHHLKPVGRLDKDSSGLLILTNDGQLAQSLTHPRQHKIKVYQVTLNKALTSEAQTKINNGLNLEDGISHLKIIGLSNNKQSLTIEMFEGKNRQIRRTFQALNYKVEYLHRTNFDTYSLKGIAPGKWQIYRTKDLQ